jgi:hypothetical protein
MLILSTEVELEVGDMTRLEIMEADVILDNSTPCCPLQVQYNMRSWRRTLPNNVKVKKMKLIF